MNVSTILVNVSLPGVAREYHLWVKLRPLLALSALIPLACVPSASVWRVPGTPPDASPPAIFSELRCQVGDQPSPFEEGFDPSSWPVIQLGDLPDKPTIYWLHIKLEIVDDLATRPELWGLKVSILGAFELYWDQRQIAISGAVGNNRASEVPGPLMHHVPLEREWLSAGHHTIALRVSNYHAPAGARARYYDLALAPYDSLIRQPLNVNLVSLTLLGAFLIVGLYYGMLYRLATPHRSYLVLSLLCLATAALIVAESWKALFGYTYDWHITRLAVVTALTAIVSFLLPLFLLSQFDFRRPGRWLSPLALVEFLALLAPSWDAKSIIMALAGILMSLVIASVAVRQRLPGSQLALCGVLALILAFARDPLGFLNESFFLGLAVMIVLWLASLTLVIRDREERHRRALQTSARLETELLKKNIQPHFLLNTLTSVVELIEQDAAAAVELVEDLADEFRLLSSMASQRLVPIERELDLCQRHLAVMSVRRNMRYEIEIRGFNSDWLVPPAIFHTLLENGITHGPKESRTTRFVLIARSEGASVVFQLNCPAAGVGPRRDVAEGTGLKYVRARLEESFPGAWELDSEQVEDTWRTTIKIQDYSAARGDHAYSDR